MSTLTADVGVAIQDATEYPIPPFHPPESYPEFSESWLDSGPSDEHNRVYSIVREALFRHLGAYDAETNGIDLAGLRRLGNVKKIVVKPNWVYQQKQFGPCVTTHGSILRPLVDYLFLAFGSRTEIIVADVPLQSANLDEVWAETGIDSLRDFYQSKGLPVRFLDLRREKLTVDSSGFIAARHALSGDPLGYVETSLDSRSHLEPITSNKSIFSVNDYEPGTTTCYHRPGVHSYLISKTVLSADLFVNVAKFKTHCKAGITGCMKNLIGINCEKGWIPHFRAGAPTDGGDEFPDGGRHLMRIKNAVRNALQGRDRRAYNFAQGFWKKYKERFEAFSLVRLTSGGAWPGNDTLWRSILDLVNVVAFVDADGNWKDRPQRHHLCVIDGVICGEGEGPLQPTSKAVGLVLCSSNPVSADWAAAHIAGFDWKRIAQLYYARELSRFGREFPNSPADLTVSWSGGLRSNGSITDLPVFRFKSPSGWAGYIENTDLPNGSMRA